LQFSIIIPYYNGQETIERLLETVSSDIKVLLVDDKSTVKIPDLSRFKNLQIIEIPNKGYFTGAVNYGIQNCSTDVLILNQDTYFVSDLWIEQVESLLEQGYGFFGERIVGDNPKYPKGYVHGTFMYISRKVVERIGLLDAKLFPMWGSTADYQTKAARAGFKVYPIEEVKGFVHLRPKTEGFGKSFKELLRDEPQRKKEFVLTPPLVSVVIPCYNFSKYLKDAVHSLVGGETSLGTFEQQTFSAFEVIIVDDSSTDNTPKIISELVDDYKNIRSIRLNRTVLERGKYAGKPTALNEGIKAAWGKYIVVLDADDMMETDRLQRMFEAIEENPNHIIYDNATLFNGSERGNSWTLSDYDFNKLIHKNIVHASIMFPREAWKKIGGYPARFRLGREDWAINVKFGEHGFCGYRIPNYHGLLYRRHDGNRTLVNTKDEWMRFFREQMKREFAHLYRGERPMACCGRGAKTQIVREEGMKRTVINVAPEGSTLLIYSGVRTVSFHVYGFNTKIPYRVMPGVPFAADNRDLISDNPAKYPGLLDLLNEDNKTYKFQKYQVEEVQQIQQISQVEEILSLVEETKEEEVIPLDFSILDGNMTALESAVEENNYSKEELNLLLAYEISNKNRLGAKRLLEGKLDETL